jgi:hypothetical protein
MFNDSLESRTFSAAAKNWRAAEEDDGLLLCGLFLSHNYFHSGRGHYFFAFRFAAQNAFMRFDAAAFSAADIGGRPMRLAT